ncbi:MAG TPA: PTS sugar transporter subunit IIA [Pseudogracilibacillus sp.]|nr:PTS sugar transporter subunit IIA [Pseudogracilibacillus sp.]
MIGFLITGHDDFSTGLKTSLDMIAGEQEKLEIVPFKENMSLETFSSHLKEAVERLNEDEEGVIIFSDLLGGTPFRISMLLTSEFEDIEVLTGTNLPMILEAISLRSSNSNIESLVQDIIQIGVESIKNPKVDLSNESDNLDDSVEDGI